jgi:hypothetical protein
MNPKTQYPFTIIKVYKSLGYVSRNVSFFKNETMNANLMVSVDEISNISVLEGVEHIHSKLDIGHIGPMQGGRIMRHLRFNDSTEEAGNLGLFNHECCDIFLFPYQCFV